MPKRKSNKKQRQAPKIKSYSQSKLRESAVVPPAKPASKAFSLNIAVKWFGSLVGLLGTIAGLLVLYPWLSITRDYSFDPLNPYNTAFYVTNEGFLPLTDISVTCIGDFTMRSADGVLIAPLGTSTEYKNFAKSLKYKDHLSLPCNHNVVANGNKLDPDAKLGIIIHYKTWRVPLLSHQTFHLRTVVGADGVPHWDYRE